MCNKIRLRKLLALVLCLAILAGMALLPALAAPGEETGDASVEAPAEAVEAPAKKEETPAEKEEAPAEKEDASAEKEEAPAEKKETPADTEETPDEKEETPAEKEEAPADKEEAPDEKEESPAVKEEAPDEKEETPAEKEEAPARQPRVPARREEPTDETPEVQEPEDEEPTEEPAALFGLDRFDSDNGFAIDWSQEDLQDNGQGRVHGVVKTDNGYYLYFDTPEWDEGVLNVQTPSHPNSWAPAASFISAGYDTRLLNGAANRAPWEEEGIEIVRYTSGGRRYTEAFIPAELLPQEDLTFVNNDASFFFAAPAVEAEPTPEPVYNGIVIDGDYADWAAVPKTPADNGNDAFHADMEVAAVWDGEYVYLYLHYLDGNANAVGAYGPRGDGQFAITTDLGRTMLIQPQFNGRASIGGVDGAQVALDNWDRTSTEKGHELEIAIPVSALPEYLESISFGYYMVEPLITGIVDMTGSSQGVGPFGGNVVIDGKYNDWVGYPHTLIEYDTPGIQHHKVDGEGALWSDDGVLYGHVVTEHPDHLEEQGSEYLAAISIAFNGDHDPKALPEDGNFYPRILAISEDGTVTDFFKTQNEYHKLPEGTHTFYIFDTRTDPIYQFSTFDENNTLIATPTAAELKANAFGTMKITVTGAKDDMEFDLDLEKVANYIGADANDFKVIEAQFGRIGQQWITTAGTPTGPVLGVALLIGAVGAPMCYSAAKKRRQAKSAAGVAEK